jgi:hypothetical protein
MQIDPRHWQTRETRFVGLIALAILLIGLQLRQAQDLAAHQGAGHRVIDLATLQRQIGEGRLRDREAQWYRPTRPDEESPRRAETAP